MADTGTLARPYAKAIFELANADKELAAWSKTLSTLAEIMNDASAKDFISRIDLTNEERVRFLQEICADMGESEMFTSRRGENFLRLLAENERFMAAKEIALQFEELKAWAENTVKVQLVTATGVNDSVVEKIKSSLEKKLGRAVELELKEDPELIGGAVIHAEGRVIDGSVKSRLSELSETLAS
ncbi:MAG: F0F1 ATP synthase subunit delta [Rhodospirillaceae bacterium]|nr:F0F1 ATP synthase subunit delta [Rhodospirillaceae bacterium]|tara:strand:+ start:102 stop:656 length:555 start_codon:yes stop_codon:yes gene_type:complete